MERDVECIKQKGFRLPHGLLQPNCHLSWCAICSKQPNICIVILVQLLFTLEVAVLAVAAKVILSNLSLTANQTASLNQPYLTLSSLDGELVMYSTIKGHL